MKGDFSRLTFDNMKHYRGTRLQQGRVSVDADWNEQGDITNYRFDTETIDIVGRCGAPLHNAGFHIVRDTTELTEEEALLPQNSSPEPLAGPGDFYISGGRMYVAGFLVENEKIVPFTLQPELPVLTPVSGSGVYIAYLDVWERHITALEDPSIREVALGGPDTATRIKATWQVRLLRVGDVSESGSFTCLTDIPELNETPTGQLTARSEPGAVSSKPCIVAPGAGYTRLENQLYRIEVHQGGNRSNATFKWSRDNGALVSRWESQNGNEISVSSIGRDKELSFKAGMWIELIDDERVLLGQPGTLVRIESVNDRVITLEAATADGPTDFASFRANKKIRRWDSDGVLDPSNNNWMDIEDGVQVRFSNGTYRTGDYWLIPARINTGDIEWPRDGSNWLAQAPHGTLHSKCRLAVMVYTNDTWFEIHDCRPVFPPLTEFMQFDYVGGDGQEALPEEQLDLPIQVGVSKGLHPVEGARVRFTRLAANGSLLPGSMNEESGSSSSERIVFTNTEGIAEVNWQLGNESSDVTQTVRAELLAPDNTVRHLPVNFNARISIASQVWYDPGNCQTLAGSNTVQEAIDTMAGQAKLVRYGGEGQSAQSGAILPKPIQVVVANVCGPVAGATVTFLPEANGLVALTPEEIPAQSPGPLSVITDATGLAEVYWQLDINADVPCQQLEIELVDAGGLQIHQPQKLLFTACIGESGSGPCHDFLDDLRSDGVVRIPANGPLGFDITPGATMEVMHTGGVAFVGGCRFVIEPGSVTLDPSTVTNRVIIDNNGNVTILQNGNEPPSYAQLADVYEFNGQIQRIVDRRLDMTHLDDQLTQLKGRVAAKRCDRRYSIPLLVQTLPDLNYRDGRNHGFQVPIPMGLAFDGSSIWAASADNSIAIIKKDSRTGDAPELIDVGMPTALCAFDGKTRMWFTSPNLIVDGNLVQNNQVISVNIKTREVRTYIVGNSPIGIACDGDRMWVVNSSSSSVSVIDPGLGSVVRTIALLSSNNEPVSPRSIAFDGEFMWISGNTPELFRIGMISEPIRVGLDLIGAYHNLGFDGSHLWINPGQTDTQSVLKMDVVTQHVEPLNLPFGIFMCDGTRMWIITNAIGYPGSVASAFDCTTNMLEGSIPFNSTVSGAVFDGSHMWLSLSLNNSIQKYAIT